MSFWSFLRDRTLYLTIYAAFGILTVAIIQLDLVFSRASLRFANLAYIWLLGLVGLGVYLYWDYRRQAPFLRRLQEIDDAEPLDQLGFLPKPSTLEQQAFSQAWHTLYGRLRAELTEEQQRGRDNVHLVSQWAHYMKTPVAVVDLELQKLQREDIPAHVAEALHSVAEENDRLSQAIQSLLNMVRLEDFSADFRIEQIDLLSLVRQLVNEKRRLFITHRVYPKVIGSQEGTSGWPLVTSDKKWLLFVLEQVVSNAVKYSSKAEPAGQITFRCRRGEGETVLEVADNGIGIQPEDLGRVFHPFFTGANGREYAQSTGMGLYLAKQTCLKLGHRLTLKSAPAAGTQVFLHFPDDPTIFAGLTNSLTAR